MYEILSVRKLTAGLPLKYVRIVNSQNIYSRENFGKANHTVASEPFFYDTGYRHLADATILNVGHHNRCLVSVKPKLASEEYFVCGPIPMDENGKAHLSEEIVSGRAKQ